MNIDAFYILPALLTGIFYMFQSLSLLNPKRIQPQTVKAVYLRTPAGWIELDIKQNQPNIQKPALVLSHKSIPSSKLNESIRYPSNISPTNAINVHTFNLINENFPSYKTQIEDK